MLGAPKWHLRNDSLQRSGLVVPVDGKGSDILALTERGNALMLTRTAQHLAATGAVEKKSTVNATARPEIALDTLRVGRSDVPAVAEKDA